MSKDLFTRVNHNNNNNNNNTTDSFTKVNSMFLRSILTTVRLGITTLRTLATKIWENVNSKFSQFMASPNDASLPDSQFVPVNSRFAFWRMGSKKEKKLILVAVALCLLSLVLFVAVICMGAAANSRPNVCQSRECIASASMLLQNMDTRANPCEDFYGYACGRWHHSHPIPDSHQNIDWFIERKISVKREIRDALINSIPSPYEPNSVKQMRTLFSDCLDTESIENRRLDPLRNLMNDLSISLKPAIIQSGENGNPSSQFNIALVAAAAKRLAGLDILIGSSVYPDPLNNSRYIFGVTAPTWQSPLPNEFHHSEWTLPLPHTLKQQFYSAKIEESSKKKPKRREVLIRQKYMVNMMKAMLTSGLESQNDANELPANEVSNIEAAAVKIYDFEGKLYTLANTSISDIDFAMVSIEELQNITDLNSENQDQNKVIWREYFKRIFEGSNASTQNIPTVQVQMSYVQNLAKLLSTTPPSVVEGAVWWKIIDTTVPFLMRSIRGVRRAYIEEITSGQTVMSRSMVCAGVTNELMGMAVSYLFATPSFVQASQERVGQMLSDIRESFLEKVLHIDWMDEDTRRATLLKANAMKVNIAFPKWMLQNGELDRFYQGLELVKGNYLENVLIVMKIFAKKTLELLSKPFKHKMETWASDPTDVNAYYSFQDNAITVPAAILQFPFYNLGLEVLNYGAIGSILGHEVVHGFDNLGRLYDELGNYRPWWTNKTAKEYMYRTSCFINQYSKFQLQELHANVDGYITLGENIADNGGIQKAVNGYRKLKQRHGGDLPETLPGLEHLSAEQLLYLAFANLWCEQSTAMAMKWSLKEAHAPNKARIWGSLSNSRSFAETWNCPVHSPMNPQYKCELW